MPLVLERSNDAKTSLRCVVYATCWVYNYSVSMHRIYRVESIVMTICSLFFPQIAGLFCEQPIFSRFLSHFPPLFAKLSLNVNYQKQQTSSRINWLSFTTFFKRIRADAVLHEIIMLTCRNNLGRLYWILISITTTFSSHPLFPIASMSGRPHLIAFLLGPSAVNNAGGATSYFVRALCTTTFAFVSCTVWR
jgi:hypothetical protein